MTDTPTTSRPRARKPRRQIDAKLRARIEAAVERMIATLDALDTPAEDKEATGDDEDGDADDLYGASSRFAMMPSKPSLQACSKTSSP